MSSTGQDSAWACVAVMPVYNEEACIERVCAEWLREMEAVGGALLVVDDGSRDGTAGALERICRDNAACFVLRQMNGGHGDAVVNGYRQALAMGCEWVFQVDSDGEMPASQFAEMWSQRAAGDFLMGRRVGRGGAPLRLLLSRAHRMLLAALFGVTPADPNIPFRLMRASRLRALLERLPEGVFAPNVFLALMAARDGALVEGPPVAMQPRGGGVVSIRGWKTARIAARCLWEMMVFRAKHW